MADIPRRISLHDQLVELLRDGILKSRWAGELPIEAELCREFMVSRLTLRKALAQLAHEDWITLGGRGKRHHIERKGKDRGTSTARTIRVLTPFSSADLGSADHVLFEVLSERMTACGYRLEVELHPQLFKRYQPSKLKDLDALPDTAGWVLMFATEQIQRWFAACGRPTVVLGMVYDSIHLSNVYPDSSATARHAAGLLCSRGHKDLVYLIADLTSLGDRRASEVFVAEATRLGAAARIISYDATPEVASAMVQNLIASRPRPTGYVVSAPEFAITILCHLQAAGIRVPKDASLIATWDGHYLKSTYPTITRYHADGKMIGRKIGNMLLDLMRNGSGKIRSLPILPEYVPGGSLAQRSKP